MKNHLIKILILIAFLFVNYFEAYPQKDTTILYDWNKDNVLDTFIVKNIIYHSDGYPKYYSYSDLIIKMSSKIEFVLSKNILIKVEGDTSFSVDYSQEIGNKWVVKNNLLKNKFMWFFNNKKVNKSPLIFIQLEAIEEPPHLIVISLDSNAQPKIIFQKENFELSKLKDIDNDGSNELIGIICYSQVEYSDDDVEILTYDPFHVYKFLNGSYVFDLKLSETYNKKYGYGWVGKDCSEDFNVVLYKQLKKHKIIKQNEIDKFIKKR